MHSVNCLYFRNENKQEERVEKKWIRKAVIHSIVLRLRRATRRKKWICKAFIHSIVLRLRQRAIIADTKVKISDYSNT